MHSPPISSTTTSSIVVTHRTERTLYTHLIHLICRPFRTILTKPGFPQPEGSITLTPHRIAHRTCTIGHRVVEGINCYDLSRKKSWDGNKKWRRIYYLCGGGWQSPPSSQHWQLASKLAREIPHTIVSLVSYPLAPNNTAPSAVPWLLRFYRTVMEEAGEKGEQVVLAGDSSGANVVLSVVLEALREDEKQSVDSTRHTRTRLHPLSLVAICPSTDLTRSNPDISKLASSDPILTPDFIKSTAEAWRGDWVASHQRISPINADVGLLRRYGVKCHGVTGGYDVLKPDALMFREKCKSEGVSGEWLEWERQMHCFLLTWPYGVKEGREAVGWLVEVLRREGEGGGE
ncbi:Alpha/Beta hydrolase protein [Clohesyomyces aquaticus]|uniref:Alpha/Beta hydrolase protein n=1 Tax=Clohesyomyces aquaticus TaxID=1231657 RepID=A0A1Y1YTX5_9PLEO|nr:Alpha/Beta hydrolase protein [Clohesyomyces aquaticus]